MQGWMYDRHYMLSVSRVLLEVLSVVKVNV